MEGLRKISLLLILVATLHHATSHIDPRTALHIPEKIIGGVIDIVHNHKNKPIQTSTPQYPANSQQNYQQYPQYQQWNQQANYQGQGLGQSQYQGQYQNQNQGQYYPQNVPTYPQNNVPTTYPQPTYPVNNQYPVQNGGTQSQSQGQYQYPQNAGQFQGQNQQGNGMYQGQTQQQNQVQTGQNQYHQGQFQGQNQSNGQYTGQYTGQNTQFQGQNQSNGQYYGQDMGTGQFQGSGSTQTGNQASGFLVSGSQSGNQGPACVCQAWTKPNGAKGQVGPATLEKTDITDKVEM